MQCLCTRSPKEVFWQDRHTRSLWEVSWQNPRRDKRVVLARSLYKISIGGLLARLLKRSLPERSQRSVKGPQSKDLCSLHQVSVQDVYDRLSKSSVGKISGRSLLARSLSKISAALWARSLANLPLGKGSVRDVSFCARLRGHFTRAIWHTN